MGDEAVDEAIDEVADLAVDLDGTLIVDRSALDEGTIVVDRGATEATDSVLRPRIRRDRSVAVEEAGSPGADRYEPRPVPEQPARSPRLVPAASATRIVDGSLPSVDRRSRRWSLLALAAVIAACVVSVVGLTFLVGVVLGG